MGTFKDNIQKYYACALSNAVPVGLCFNCLTFFDIFKESYENILNGNETINENVIQCADKYLNQDGLNTVEFVYTKSHNLWDEAYCETCFDRKKDNIPKSEDVQEFEKSKTLLEKCITNNKKSDPCKNCSIIYEQLNKEYELLEDTRKGNICFDVQDKVCF